MSTTQAHTQAHTQTPTQASSLLRTVLVANRGEIALRVFRTCRRLGIRTVAICTETDRAAPHVRAADQVVPVGSYLDVDAVVDAAVQAGADAIHPGYGFLSERAELAHAVAAAGLTLVGPAPEVMEQMGRKDLAREIAVTAGVPVVPSYAVSPESDHPDDSLTYPVLVKAAAGGGGKGMRVVRSADEYAAALAAARREAASAFGDDTLLVEKYVESGRHVEVQVLGDGHGHVVHLFERDCSTQRRHQKVLEEAPAPTITGEQRERITSAAVALAAQVGYVNAGTVEFLLDVSPDGDGDFYFLEMNTRLQVEHPVTEEVVRVRGERVDLVELQLRVAAGEALDFSQDDVTLEGHAIEARVYAEDSFGGFLPQAGTASIVRWPTGPGVRTDHALEGGGVVSTSYDPMLGKVIAHGADREAARRTLVSALDRTAILGLTTNTGFLRTLLAGDDFRDAAIDTAWLDGAVERGELTEPDPELPLLIGAWTDAALVGLGDAQGHPFAADGWRLAGAPAPVLVELEAAGEQRTVQVDRAADAGGRAGTADGHAVVQLELADHVVELGIDGRRHRAVVNAQAHGVEVVHQGHRHVFPRPDAFGDHAVAAGDGTLLAPMPGTVLEVTVTAGEAVVAGQVLGMMEAMKMELALKAPFDGTVTEVLAQAGGQVALGETLFVVEEGTDR